LNEGTCPLGVPIRTRVRGVASAFTGGCRCPGNLGADRGIRQRRSCGVEPAQQEKPRKTKEDRPERLAFSESGKWRDFM